MDNPTKWLIGLTSSMLIISLLIIGVIVCTVPNKVQHAAISIEIEYNGVWGGYVAFGDNITSIHGNGTFWINKTFNNGLPMVSAAIGKADNLPGQLGVRLYLDGKLIDEAYSQEMFEPCMVSVH